MSVAEHVPAWKRVGLKLKRPGHDDKQKLTELKADSITENELHSQSPKRSSKRPRVEDAQHEPSKRFREDRKTAATTSTDPLPPSANDRFISSIYKGKLSSNGATKTPQKIIFNDNGLGQNSPNVDEHSRPLTRKKSVTFTPETKAEDGESGQAFAKAWLSPNRAQPPELEQDQDTPTKPPVTAPTGLGIDIPSSYSDQKVKSKQKKRPREKEGLASPSNGSEVRSACVAYLQQYANNRASWKFKKSSQNDLLRHIWDVSVLPTSLNDIIVEYIRGLQGEGPRKRLYQGATEILDKLVEKYSDDHSESGMDTPEARKAAYEKAMHKQLEIMKQHGMNEREYDLLASDKLEAEQAARAQALLWQVLWREVHPGEPDPFARPTGVKPATFENAQAASNRKSRKSRTFADDSSSGSSESESSSESASEDETSESSSDESDDDSSSSSSSSTD